MARFLNDDWSIPSRKFWVLFLALSWIIGLISGCIISITSDTFYFIPMRAATYCRVSIVSLLVVTAFPFLFSAFVFYFAKPWLFIPIACMKAMSFSMVAIGIFRSFGSAGWLLQFLLMFSDICLIPFLIFYWVRFISSERAIHFYDILCVSTAVLSVGLIDFYFISPILVSV